MLVDSNIKSLDDRLGNSPEKLEKKTAKKGQTFWFVTFILYNMFY